jgi:lysophospholipase L1-like esterase
VAAFSAAALLASLLLAELVARAVWSPPDPIYAAHPYLRHVRAPESTYDLIAPAEALDGDQPQEFTLHVDAHGFRHQGLEPPGQPKAAGTYRIFFVGASTTENVALPDEQTFPYLVEQALRERLDGQPKVFGVNTAISGNSIADSFSLVAHRLLALEPDLIVVLHATNDMRTGVSSRFDPTHYADRLPPPRVRPGHAFREWIRLAGLASHVGDRLGGESRAARVRERRRAAPFTEADPSLGLPYFRRYLGMLSAVCRDAEVPLVLMTMPSLYRADLTPEEDAALWLGYLNHGELNLDTPTLLRGMQLFNEAIRETARDRGHLLIDLAPVVPRDLEHFYDDVHFTAAGNRVVAEHIVDALLAGGGLPD